MKTKYTSAVDTWLVLILIGVPTLVTGFGVATLFTSPVAGFIVIGTGVLVGFAISLFAFPCYYVLDAESLKIKCGLVEEEVPYRRVQHVEKSGSLLSAPGLSTKRVKVVLDEGFRLISPRDREEFIQAISQKIKKTEPNKVKYTEPTQSI